MTYQIIEETLSTNSYCREHREEFSFPTAVLTLSQTAGRGQRGNSWESEPGKNLTFSILCGVEGVKPSEQFAISEATALGVRDYLREKGVDAMVKWPNDIYAGDKKICGILIEHSLMGSRIEYSILGIGINLNQKEFRSNAPNPVSLSQLTGEEYRLEEELRLASQKIEGYLSVISTPEGRKRLHQDFLSSLWRRDGDYHRFRDRKEGREIEARIMGVEEAGTLVLHDREGNEHRYAFKEVEYIL